MKISSQAVVAHAFNTSTPEAEAAGWIFMSSRPLWSTELVPGLLYTEKSCLEKQTKKRKPAESYLSNMDAQEFVITTLESTILRWLSVLLIYNPSSPTPCEQILGL